MNTRALIGMTVLWGLVACVFQGMTLWADLHASNARSLLKSGHPAAALEKANSALRFNPVNQHAAYTQWVALKRLARWIELAAKAGHGLEWHPNSPAIHLLAGEAHWQNGHRTKAAQHFRSSLWCRPNPERSAAQFWLSALLGSADEWGIQDPRLPGMAVRTLRIAEEDPDLTSGEKKRIMNQVAALLDRTDYPLTAKAIRQMETK